MKYVLVMFILLFTINLQAEEYLLEGTIGKYPVVMKLDIEKGYTTAKYFYKSTCRDIELNGNGDKQQISLVTDDSTEKWTIQQLANKTWKGEWSSKNKKFDIALKSVDINNINHRYASLPIVKEYKAKDEYEYVRSSMIDIVKDTSGKSPALLGSPFKGKYTLQEYHLKGTKVALFTVEAGLDAAVAAKVNNILMSKLMENASHYCSCGSFGNDVYFDYSVSSIYLTDNILSINLSIATDCKGQAHPDEGNDCINIDAKTGKELELNDVLFFPHLKTQLGEIYTDEVYKLLKKLHPREMISNPKGCDYSSKERWQYLQWWITSKGVFIAPDFQHVEMECKNPEWSYVPFDVLKKYRNPNKTIILP